MRAVLQKISQAKGFSLMRPLKAVCVSIFCALMILAPAAHANCSLPEEGLIGHWKLDASSGTVVSDSVNGNNGSFWNSPTWLPTGGKVDGALDLNGVTFDSMVIIPHNANMDFTGDFTTSFWVKSTQAAASGTWPWMVVKGEYPGTGYQIALHDSNTNSGKWYGQIKNGGGDYTVYGKSNVADGQWHHLALTREGSVIKTYQDGEYVASVTAMSTSIASTDDMYLGYGDGDPTLEFDGALDDVRIYNRALDAGEIAALYSIRSTDPVPAGYMVYNAHNAIMQYCNGTNWVNAGIGSYNPDAVSFDGTNDWLSTGSDLTGVADGKKVTGSFWFRRTGAFSQTNFFFYRNLDYFRLGFSSTTNKLQIKGNNSGGTQILLMESNTAFTDTNWHHVAFSFDLSDTAKRYIYIDGVSDMSVTTYTNNNLSLTGTSGWSLGATVSGAQKTQTDFADFWVDFGTYMDLSVASNLRKFRSPLGLPAYLGQDGSLPTGTAPDIFLSGNLSGWKTNKGTGGGFTENGALSYGATQPGDASILQTDTIKSDLVGYWPLDESSGTVAYDYVSARNLTFSGSPTWAPTGGKIQGGLTTTSGNEAAVADDGNALDLKTNFSVSFWIKYNSDSSTNGFPIAKSGGATPSYVFRHEASSRDLKFQVWNTATTQTQVGYYVDYPLGTWMHVVGVKSGANVSLYVDNVLRQTVGTFSGTPADTTGNFRVGGIGDVPATIDDVMVFDRALSATDIAALYNAGLAGHAGFDCNAPYGQKREIIYNSDSHVIQYCNGVDWVAMGPVSGTPPTNGLVSLWKFNEASGTTAADSAGSNNGTLNSFPASPWNTTGGVLNGALTFDDVDDNVSVANNASLNITNDLTIAVWVKKTGTYGDLVVKGLNDNSVWDYGLWMNSSNNVRFYSDQTTPKSAVSNIVITDSQWHHIAVVRDSGAGTATFYMDGIQDSTAAMAGAFGSNAYPLHIGKGGDSSHGDTLGGLMDDVRIYNRALSASEISALYYYGASGGVGDVTNACTIPTGKEGQMVYNATHNYMQYCNGTRWVAIGK